MFAAELLFAMLAVERQEIDEVAVLSGALVSDGEEFFRLCGHGCIRGIGGRCVNLNKLIYALTKVDAQAFPLLPTPSDHAAEGPKGWL